MIRSNKLECRLDDGTILVADAWCPDSDGSWPVLLQRLPYGRSVASAPVLPHPSWLASKGYLVVVQDVRGRGDSEGDFEPFDGAASDGFAAIEWAARLPQSSGVVGTYGFSYQGLLQLYAAAEQPPSLGAIAPMMCAPDPYEGWTYEGGALRWPFACFWAAQLAGLGSGEGPIPFNTACLPPSMALGEKPPAWFSDWLDHPNSADPFWTSKRPDISSINVPAFTVAGWFDDFSSATLDLAQRLGADLHIGPWGHMPWGSLAGSVELGPEAGPSHIWPAMVEFFDRHLKHEGVEEPPAVRYFTNGRGWQTTTEWPPKTLPTRLFGNSEGNANSRHGDGCLGAEPFEGRLTDVIVVEPLVPYPGGSEPLSDEGAAEDRRDVCCYTSDPFSTSQVLTGAPVVTATTRCDRRSYDVVASLVLVTDGEPPRRLSTTIQRLDPAPVGIERITQLTLRPISWEIPPGSCLRVDLSGGRFPAFDRNPHTGEVPTTNSAAADTLVATLEILEVEVELPLL